VVLRTFLGGTGSWGVLAQSQDFIGMRSRGSQLYLELSPGKHVFIFFLLSQF